MSLLHMTARLALQGLHGQQQVTLRTTTDVLRMRMAACCTVTPTLLNALSMVLVVELFTTSRFWPQMGHATVRSVSQWLVVQVLKLSVCLLPGRLEDLGKPLLPDIYENTKEVHYSSYSPLKLILTKEFGMVQK